MEILLAYILWTLIGLVAVGCFLVGLVVWGLRQFVSGLDKKDPDG